MLDEGGMMEGGMRDILLNRISTMNAMVRSVMRILLWSMVE